jgi:hypothetical protein
VLRVGWTGKPVEPRADAVHRNLHYYCGAFQRPGTKMIDQCELLTSKSLNWVPLCISNLRSLQ